MPSFNWLKDYDRRAQDFQRATDWTEYSLFAFARFPRLQPASDNSFFSGEVARWKKQIEQHAKAKLVLTGLSDARKEQLAALVSDAMDDLERFVNRRQNKKRFHKLAIEGKSWTRMLQSKYRSACQAVEDLSRYCAKRDSIISFEFRQRALAALETLRPSDPPKKTTLEHAGPIRDELAAISRDPTTEAMVHLYWFFRSGCRLEGHDAEVRTALIRNAFWTSLGIAQVDCREDYQDHESRGCDAVKQAVRRFKRHQGTAR